MKTLKMQQTRAYNFSAGPATLPESLLLEARAELLNWNGLGLSVMEISHRSAPFLAIMDDAEASLRSLLAVPDHYHVLFLGGAARTQFAMIPMNLLAPDAEAAYLISGCWSTMAYTEACRLKKAYCVATSESSHFTTLPDYHPAALHPDTTYLYYTPNETVDGVRFPTVPSCGEVPLIADMTSCLLSEPINVTDYGLIFAGAQKNIAPAGLTVVIVRADLLKNTPEPVIPTMLDYRIHAAKHSSYATPPTFNCYMAGKMFHWIEAQGGVDALYQINCLKAAKLYQFIDESSFYHSQVAVDARSIVNVCFTLSQPERIDEFVQQATRRGLFGLKGHTLVGGLRASIYNAMPMAGVDALIAFMREFSQ